MDDKCESAQLFTFVENRSTDILRLAQELSGAAYLYLCHPEGIYFWGAGDHLKM